MSANIRLEDWIEKRMADPEFRAAWEASEPGYQVALLRIRRGLTQKELAELVGTKQSSIARLESGKTEPRLSFLRKVVEALGGQLLVQIAAGEDRTCQQETAPNVRASLGLAYSRPGDSKEAMRHYEMAVRASQQSTAVDIERSWPRFPRRHSFWLFNEENAEIETGSSSSERRRL